MENCLLTTLKGEIQGDGNMLLGGMQMSFKATNSPSASNNLMYLNIKTGSAAEVSSVYIKVVEGDARILDRVPSDWSDHSAGVVEKELIHGGIYNLFLTNADCKLEIRNKYNLIKMQLNGNISVNADDLFMPNMGFFAAKIVGGELSTLEAFPTNMSTLSINDASPSEVKKNAPLYLTQKNIETLSLGLSECTIPISELLSHNTSLKELNIYGSYFSGDLSYFLVNGALKFGGLTRINVSNCPYIRKASEDVTALRNLGVTVIV